VTWKAGAAAILASLGSLTSAHAVTLARGGTARAVIVLAADPIPSEKTAAAELAAYLEKITGARFEIVADGAPRPEGPAIFVGPTGLARRLGLNPARMGPEEWAIRAGGPSVVLAGGRPRGTIYAVYHFLEDELGVRWWNAFEESVPHRRTLRVGDVERTGHPAFAQRDIDGADGGAEFLVRNRVNGANTRIAWTYGGFEGFATPWFVHSFYRAIPPDDYFKSHPEFFSERDGERTRRDAQLCLTNPAIPSLVAAKFAEYAAAADAAAAAGSPPPRLFDFSQNDWGGPCACDACRAVAGREDSEAGPVLDVVNDIAARLAVDHPDALVTTLAYTYTFPPPAHVSARDNVVVRLAPYGKRDFSKGVLAPENEPFRSAVTEWSRHASRLWIWDYAVVFFDDERNLPMPSYRYYADDFRFYRDHGVSGLFVQHEFPIAADLRDLKVWLYLKLMEEPDRDEKALLREFTDGYYGKAAGPIRNYLAFLESAADAQPGYIGAESGPEAFRYVDAEFVVRAETLFDRAEAAVRADPVRLRRVRHARLTVDYALLQLDASADLKQAAKSLGVAAPDRRAVALRYRQTWDEQIELRAEAKAKAALRSEIDDEVGGYLVDDD
jgi:Domain of unknown function (DUF4838)